MSQSTTRAQHRASTRLSAPVSTTARVSAVLAVTGGIAVTSVAPADAAQAVGTLRAPAAPAATALSAHGGIGSGQAARVALPRLVWAHDLVEQRDTLTADRASTPARRAGSAKERAAERTGTTTRVVTQRKRTQSDAGRPSRSTDRPDAGSSTSGRDESTGSTSGVLAIAKRYIGTPYRYGGSTPAAFDCSGFTSYVFRQVGIELPRSSRAQQAAVRRVYSPRPGDLVFYGFPAHHVAIYVGDGKIIDSAKPGTTISIHKIWGSNVSYGRVG